MDLGGRLLPCIAAALDDGGSAVQRGEEVVVLGAKDAEAIAEARRNRAGAALGGGVAMPNQTDCETARRVRASVQVFTNATRPSALCGVSKGRYAHRQRSNRSGVQDGLHPAFEVVRNALAQSRRAADTAFASH